MRAYLTLGLVLALAVLTASQTNYCNICSDHTLCQYTGKSTTCKFTADSVPLTAAEKDNIVHLHNVKRNLVASGQEDIGNPGPQPSAANMKTLVWDDDLATIAQRWADQCNYGHDTCRNDKNGWVGQNVAMTWGSANYNPGWDSPVDMWYDEVKDFDSSGVDSYTFAMNTGHYTEVVWANVAKIGCGFSKYESDTEGYVNTLFVCNYGPGGNMVGEAIYQTGPPRSACPNSPLNNAYPALCGV